MLAARVAGAGAEVVVAACDVADRGALAGLVTGAGQRLSGVYHAAGVLDDGVVTALTPARANAVLRPKVDGALVLDELTAGCELAEFVLFSSAAATFGSPGQGSYAAANAALDALAERRRAQGLPGTSVAWGLWQQPTGMTGHLSEGDVRRATGLGAALSPGQGLGLLDAVRGRDQAVLVAANLDTVALRTQADKVPPLLRGLVRAAARTARADGAAAGGLSGRLAGLSPGEQEQAVLEVVRAQAASVLGHASAEAVPAGAVFRELGFDSLTAIELRNRLTAVTGLRLPATLVFDYPTPAVLAAWLRGKLAGSAVAAAPVVVRAASEEPVAIVAMSCRFPGGVATPEQLWDLVAAGIDAMSEFPADRGWPDAVRAGERVARVGGFVNGVGEFDPGFFGISPREALAMDPQQRLLLELAWEVFERAGIDPADVRGTPTGVYAGTSGPDYSTVLAAAGGEGDSHVVTGNAGSVVSGRVAYVFGLEGPAVSVDTACSSSLVALHLACQALRAGECELALAGGVTVMATPAVFAEFGRQEALAADGRCKAFSAAADGTGWAEGAGLVLVERLSDAQRLGHRVLAVVAGSAVNQDGASNGLTAPNGPSQQRVIRQALASAGVSTAGVDVVEGHGTGTTLGDPIEAQALLATYGQDRPEDRPLWLGSVKSNFGHAQAAAGIAGVIKMVMALQAGLLPPTLHVGKPSSHVDWSSGAVQLLTEPCPWPGNGHPRRAGVSSFGISGTNAHLILEQAPPVPEPVVADGAGGVGGAMPWVVSARGAGGLRAQARQLEAFTRSGAGLVDVGYSLATRARFADRAVVVAADAAAMASGLAAVGAGDPAAGVVQGTAATGDGPPRVAFVFAGQGSQRAGMGRGLAARFPVFAGAVGEVCGFLDPLLGCSVEEVIFAGEGDAAAGLVDRTVFAQAGLFAVGVGLARLLGSWGVVPDFVAGHSVGEITAAAVAGMLPLGQACGLVAARGVAMGALAGGGAMVAVAASEAEVAASLAGVGGRVSVAAVNGPGQVVISGAEEAVLGVAGWWRERGVRVRRLRVSHGFHSPLMDPALGALAEAAGRLTPVEPVVPVVSGVTGEVLTTERAGSAGYWVDQARQPVRFADVVGWLAGQGVGVFAELGPDGALSALGPGCLPEDSSAVWVPALRPGRDEPATALLAAGELFVRGVGVDWAGLLDADGGRRVDLPTYAFVRQRYWPQPARAPVVEAGDVAAAAGLEVAGHPLLAAAVELADDAGVVLTGRLSVAASAVAW